MNITKAKNYASIDKKHTINKNHTINNFSDQSQILYLCKMFRKVGREKVSQLCLMWRLNESEFNLYAFLWGVKQTYLRQ